MAKYFLKALTLLAALCAAAPGETAPDTTAKPELAPGEIPLAARGAVAVDLKTGAFLYEKNPDAIEYPASATKILTALVVIEAGDLDKAITVEKPDTEVEPSSLPLVVGEKYPRKHLLYALLLKSANDVALALARDNAGSVKAFCEKMNRRAAEAGAIHSHFTNPNGLHDPHHFTTARDMALIGKAAMKNDLFRRIVATPEVWMAKGDEWIMFRNHNKLLAKFPGCIGLKTGFTRAAQQVLVSAAHRDGNEVLSVVLHTNKPGIWDDSAALLDEGFKKLAAPNIPGPAPAPAAPKGEPQTVFGVPFPPTAAGP